MTKKPARNAFAGAGRIIHHIPGLYPILSEFGFTAHIRPRGEEAQAIKRQAGWKRTAVDGGTSAFLDEPLSSAARSALEKKPENYLAFLHFACGLIANLAAGLFA